MPRSSSTTTTPKLPLTDDAIEHAERELADYFTRRHDNRRHEGWRATVEAVLATIPAYHRGVLSLYHADRSWPPAIRQAFGDFAWIAIRLDCCDHPAVGSTPALEAAAAERITAIITKNGPDRETVDDLLDRAADHVDHAVRAYAKARRKHTKAAPAPMDLAAE